MNKRFLSPSSKRLTWAKFQRSYPGNSDKMRLLRTRCVWWSTQIRSFHFLLFWLRPQNSIDWFLQERAKIWEAKNSCLRLRVRRSRGSQTTLDLCVQQTVSRPKRRKIHGKKVARAKNKRGVARFSLAAATEKITVEFFRLYFSRENYLWRVLF